MRKLFGLLGVIFLAVLAGFFGGLAVLATQAVPSCKASPTCIVGAVIAGAGNGNPRPVDRCISEADAVSIQKLFSVMGQGVEVNGPEFIGEWRSISAEARGCVTIRETIEGACRSVDGGLGGDTVCTPETIWQP